MSLKPAEPSKAVEPVAAPPSQGSGASAPRPAAHRKGLLAAALLLHAMLVVSVAFEARPAIRPLHNDIVYRLGPAADFFAVYHAAVNLEAGESPYVEGSDATTPPHYPFRYLPIVGHVARPLLMLSPGTARVLWIVCLEGLLLALLLALRKRMEPSRWLGVSALLLASSPFFLELYMGQFTFAAMTLFALALLLPNRVFFHAAVLLKVFPLAALPAFVRRRGGLRTALEVAGLVVVVSAPYFLAHPQDWTLFVETNFRPTGGLDAGNFGWVRVLFLIAIDLSLPFTQASWDTMITGIRLVVLGACALLALRSRGGHALPAAVMLVLAHFVTYAHVWEHHLSGVMVLGALLLTLPGLSKRDVRLLYAALLVCALPTPFVLFDVPQDPPVWDPSLTWPRPAAYALVLSKAVPVALLFGWCIARVRRDGLEPLGAGLLRSLDAPAKG